MSKEVLQESDFAYTMFMHLYNEYNSLVQAVSGGEREYERLKNADIMYEAWEKANLPSGEYAGKKYIQNIQSKYAQLWYWKNMLNKYLGDRYAEHRQAPPEPVRYPAGYEQAFQAIVLQSVQTDDEKFVEKVIDWSKFCHLHEQLRKTWGIELSTTHYTNYSGKVDKVQFRPIKDNPQA